MVDSDSSALGAQRAPPSYNNYNDACSAYGLTDCKITKQKLVDRQILKDDQRTMYRSLDFNFGPKELLQMEINQK